MKKKRMIVLGSLLVAALLLFAVWNSWFSATKIGFINYQYHYPGRNFESQ